LWAICPPFCKPSCSSSFHLFPLRIKNINEEQRNTIIQKISEQNVSVNVHFIPLPLLTVFKENYSIENFPQSYLLYSTEISLPIYPQLTNEECQFVINAVINAVESFV